MTGLTVEGVEREVPLLLEDGLDGEEEKRQRGPQVEAPLVLVARDAQVLLVSHRGVERLQDPFEQYNDDVTRSIHTQTLPSKCAITAEWLHQIFSPVTGWVSAPGMLLEMRMPSFFFHSSFTSSRWHVASTA